jgi:polyisoprenyl-teichoic acid--peptidoglycan teichoic acid transferase
MAEALVGDYIESPERTRRRRRKAPIAAFWSFVFPGGGQLYNHQRGLGLLLALPIAMLVIVGAVVVVLQGSRLLASLLDTRVLLALIVADVAIMGWRLMSILHAHRFRARFGLRRAGTWVTGLLVVLTIGMHLIPAWYGWEAMETLSAVALGGTREQPESGDPGGGLDVVSGPSGEPLPRPSVLPQVERGERVNVLLVGVDSGVGRDHALTDTMMVVSLDADGGSAMLSVPRDLVNAPLPNAEPYPFKLNSLLQNANANPDAYPFGGGVATLKATIGNLLGVPIHYFAAVDMAGFQHLIDAIGGVVVDVSPRVADPVHNLYLEPGRMFMDGQLALTYVRSRYGTGNDDFVRTARQQQVLTAVRDKLTAGNLVLSLPSILDAIQSTIATDVPQDRIAELAQAIQDASATNIERAVLQPPEYVTPATGADGAYILLPDLDAIRELGQRLIGD